VGALAQTASLTLGELAGVESLAVPPTSSLTDGGSNPSAERSGTAWMPHRDGKSHHDATPTKFG
jgi:hypothetical protein